MPGRPKHAHSRARSRRYLPGLAVLGFVAPAAVMAYPAVGVAGQRLVLHQRPIAASSPVPPAPYVRAQYVPAPAVPAGSATVGRRTSAAGAPALDGPGAGPSSIGTPVTTTSSAGTPATSTSAPGSPATTGSAAGSPSRAQAAGGSATGPSASGASSTTTVPPTTTTTVPIISGGPSIQPITGAPVGPPGNKPNHKGKQTTTTQPAPAGPPPGTGLLLSQIDFEQRQMASLDAYVDARQYLARARRHLAVDLHRLDQAVAVWRADVARERADQAVENADARTVALYQRALFELGLAEYTGQAVNEGSDLAALDSQMDASLLGEVAASRTQHGLRVAERELAVATVRTQRARQAVATAATARRRAAHRVRSARSQVALSRRDVVVATDWATIPGRAPASPLTELPKLEGPLGAKHHRAKAGPELGGDHLSSFSVVTGPVPGSVIGPPTTLPSATTTVPAATTTSTGPAATSTSGLSTTGSTGAGSTGAGSTGAGSTGAGSTGAGASASAGQVGASGTWASLMGEGPGVLGTPLLTASQIFGWFESTGARANPSVPMRQLVSDYLKAGESTGVRGDIAFAQSIVETGYFSFPSFGQDPASYNNFAGIGACDKCKHGWKFPTAMAGVLSQELLLAAYATPPAEAPGGSRAPVGVEGCCTTWMALSGVWASNKAYGFEILSVYHQMLAYSLAADLARAGLNTVVPAGPGPANAPAVVNPPAKSEPTPSRTGRT